SRTSRRARSLVGVDAGGRHIFMLAQEEGSSSPTPMSHPELAEQTELNKSLRYWGKELSIPLIATQDSHYLEKDDGEAQDIMVCIQTGKTVNDANRLDMRQVDSSLKTENQLRQELPDFHDAIDNAADLAEELTVELSLGQRYFPTYPTPEKETPEAYLRLLTEHGLAKHYKTGVPDDVRQRLEYELNIIMKKGYASYFLAVADFVNWSRQQGIIATTRGSAAGSLTSFLIGITTVNPLTYNLPFERFLNPERPSPPDIDMDFSDNKRDKVIAYVTAKYGVDHVAQIVTFGTMAARAAVRDVGRALGYPYSLCDRVAKLIPFGQQGFPMTIKRALQESQELKELNDNDPQINKLLRLAQKVEGCVRHASVHAAGVVISPTPLTDYTPLQYDVEGKHVLTQYDMWSCEDAGLVKMDFLGIRNLSIMGNAVEIIKKTQNIDIDLGNIPLNDEKTFSLMAQGETMGMFQLGGSGMTRYLKELKPSNITDIMAMVALFRPGPMNSIPEFIKRKHNPKTISYLDPRLEKILKDSYGIITYQDDVLLIAIEMAGYSWLEADKLRKAMGKKIVKEMARQKEKFISGCITGGLSEKKAIQLWELIEPFAAYGFNKSHAASYGIVAYQTAYLKANYPTEFMSALMTAEAGDLPTIAQAVGECKRLGIKVLPPDINASLSTFTVIDDNTIRFGLNAVKNLGEQVIASIIHERKQNGPFSSLENLLWRLSGKDITKKYLESLIKCGALDSLNDQRQQLLDNMEEILAYAKNASKIKASKQTSLFGGSLSNGQPPLKLRPSLETNKDDKLSWEKELLGLYVSEHPLTKYANNLSVQTVSLNDLNDLPGEPNVTVAGLITQVKEINTKKGEAMAFCGLEDLTGNTELIAFPETYRRYRSQLINDQIILVRGKLSRKNGEKKILINSLQVLSKDNVEQNTNDQINKQEQNLEQPSNQAACSIKIPDNITPDAMQQLKALIIRWSGQTKIYFKIYQDGTWKKISTPYLVNLSPDFIDNCQKILGPDCLTS
ncbi:MAG: DNA polymerase III subunit alpha, partial [Patescibacteria group bacterium]